MKLLKVVDKLRDKFVWGKPYDSNEPIIIEPSASRLKERKPGYGDPTTALNFWVKSGRFWYFFHDIKNSAELWKLKMSDNEIADCLEQSILNYNWHILKHFDKHGISSPVDRPIDLDTIKRDGWDWIVKNTKSRCHLFCATKEKDETKIKATRKEISQEKDCLKKAIKEYAKNGFRAS